MPHLNKDIENPKIQWVSPLSTRKKNPCENKMLVNRWIFYLFFLQSTITVSDPPTSEASGFGIKNPQLNRRIS